MADTSSTAAVAAEASDSAAAAPVAPDAPPVAPVPRTPAESVKGQIFDVGPRYTNLSYIGEGAYGMVWWVVALVISCRATVARSERAS